MTNDYMPSADAIAMTEFTTQLNFYNQCCPGDVFNHRQMKILSDKMNRYINSFSDEKTQQFAAGQLLWRLKEKIVPNHPKTTGIAIDHLLAAHPISDTDKIKFLNYIVSGSLENLLARPTVERLSSVDCQNETIARQTHDVIAKMFIRLSNKKLQQNNDKYLKMTACFYPIMKNYARGSKSCTRSMIDSYARTFFEISGQLKKFNKSQTPNRNAWIPIEPLFIMMSKTENLQNRNAKMNSLFDDSQPVETKPQLDTISLQSVLNIYKERTLQTKDVDNLDTTLNSNMKKMLQHIAGNCDIDSKEVKAISENISEKYTFNLRQATINELANDFKEAHKKAHPPISSMKRCKIPAAAVGEHFYRSKIGH